MQHILLNTQQLAEISKLAALAVQAKANPSQGCFVS